MVTSSVCHLSILYQILTICGTCETCAPTRCLSILYQILTSHPRTWRGCGSLSSFQFSIRFSPTSKTRPGTSLRESFNSLSDSHWRILPGNPLPYPSFNSLSDSHKWSGWRGRGVLSTRLSILYQILTGEDREEGAEGHGELSILYQILTTFLVLATSYAYRLFQFSIRFSLLKVYVHVAKRLTFQFSIRFSLRRYIPHRRPWPYLSILYQILTGLQQCFVVVPAEPFQFSIRFSLTPSVHPALASHHSFNSLSDSH